MPVLWVITALAAVSGEIAGADVDLDARWSATAAVFDFEDIGKDSAPTKRLLGREPIRLFYEDYVARDLGYTRDLYLGLTVHRALGEWETEVGFAPRLLDAAPTTAPSASRDRGSYVRLARAVPFGSVAITGYPFAADSLRVGFREASSYPGPSPIRRGPGLRLDVEGEVAYGFVGAAGAVRDPEGRNDNQWLAMGGAGVDLPLGLYLDVQVGYARGPDSPLYTSTGESVFRARSASTAARVGYRTSGPRRRPTEPGLLTPAAFLTDTLLDEASLAGPMVDASVQVMRVWRRLVEPSSPFIVWQDGTAVDGVLGARLGPWAATVLAYRQDFAFLTRGWSGDNALDPAAETRAALGASLELSYGGLVDGLVVGASVGRERPGVYIPSTLGMLPGYETVGLIAVSPHGTIHIVEPGRSVVPVTGGKLYAHLCVLSAVTLAVELLAARDPNQSDLVRAIDGSIVRVSSEKVALGANVILRGRL